MRLLLPLLIVAIAAIARGQSWTDATGIYKANPTIDRGATFAMSGYMVRTAAPGGGGRGAGRGGAVATAAAPGWPELVKVSDRHDMWGHAIVPSGTFGNIVPGGVTERPAAPKAEQPGPFARRLVYDLPEGKKCAFTFNRLSPALWMDCEANSFAAFRAQPGGPKCVAYPTASGIAFLKSAGESLAGADLAEGWLLVWRGSDPSYQNHFIPTFLHASPNSYDQADFNKYVKLQPADAPWLVVLQHKPGKVTLNADGLTAEFAGPAGKVAILPIGGFRWYRGVDTAKWADGLPPAVAERCRAWSRYLRNYPEGMKEEYTVTNLSSEASVRVKTTFTFTPVPDDWKTQGVRLAPVSSPVGLALLTKLKNLSTMPAKFVDLDYPTLTGGLVGFENADSYTVAFADWPLYAGVPAAKETVHSNARVQARLEKHLAEMLDAGHLAPYESLQGTVEYSFWGNPADLAQTLIAARRHVGPELQGRIDAYLKAELAKYPLLDVGWMPPREGARREAYPVDLDVRDVVGRRKKAEEPAHIENLYGLFEYSREYGWGWLEEAKDEWPKVATLVHQQDDRLDWEIGYHWGGVADLNTRIKGLVGYRQLALKKGDRKAADEAAYLLTQALVNRFAFAKLSEYQFLSGQYFLPDEFDLPRFHARNAHKFNIFLPAYRKGASYRTAPQAGLVTATDRYISEIGNFWHDHSVWAWVDLTPPLARFLADTTGPELKNYLACIDEGIPTWFVTKAENLNAVGEDAYFSPYVSWPVFQARALIFREPAGELEKYVDIPCAKGDLYYIQDLVAVLEAE